MNKMADTVTVLLTDLEGSTRLWQQHPAEMPDMLARHDVVIHNAVEAEGGVVAKHTGDGMLAIFRSAHHAAAAALSIQGTLESLGFAEEVGSLHVRIALHTGEPQHRSGDYFGPTLNVCARMVTIAGPSQILVSLATRELLHGDPTPSVALTDLGEHILPDIDRPEHLYQLTNTSDLSPASA